MNANQTPEAGAGVSQPPLPDCFTALVAALDLDLHGDPLDPDGVNAVVLARRVGDAIADTWRTVARSEAEKLAGIAVRYHHVGEATRERVAAAEAALAALPAGERAEARAEQRRAERERGRRGRHAPPPFGAAARAGEIDPASGKPRWFTDDWDGMVAEVGALLRIGARSAAGQLDLALRLWFRHPRLWRLLHAGVIQLSLVRAAVAAAEAVTDPVLVDRYDRFLCARLADLLADDGAALTVKDVKALASWLLAKLDPDAHPPDPDPAERSAEWHRRRDGSVELSADFDAADGMFAAAEVERVARTVCRGDGRSLPRRRSDAMIALIRGYETLGCRCGGSVNGPDRCEWLERAPRSGAVARTGVQVRVVINASTLQGFDDEPGLTEECGTLPAEYLPAAQVRDLLSNGDPYFDTFGKVRPATTAAPAPAEPDSPEPTLFDGDPAEEPERPEVTDRWDADRGGDGAPAPERRPRTGTEASAGPGPGLGRMPEAFGGPGLRRRPAIRCGNRSGQPGVPDQNGQPARPGSGWRVVGTEPNGYRPSALQAEYVFLRHATCTFPGCAIASRNCQIDHVDEWMHSDPTRGGRTAVGNEIPLCGRHHRLKTEQDWTPVFHPDGTVEWISPTGMLYSTGLIRGTDAFPDLDLLEWEPSRRPRKPRDPAAAPAMTRTETQNLRRRQRREDYIRRRAEREAATAAAVEAGQQAPLPTRAGSGRG